MKVGGAKHEPKLRIFKVRWSGCICRGSCFAACLRTFFVLVS